MIETKEQWFKTLRGLLARLAVVRATENPGPYQVMTQVKKFLVVEKIGPDDLRKELINVLDKGILNTNADVMASHMRHIISEYTKKDLQNSSERIKEKIGPENQKQKSEKYWDVFLGRENA